MTQAISYEGLTHDKIHPTDIDAVIEIDDKYLFLFEVKHVTKVKAPPTGQRLMLHRLADAWAPRHLPSPYAIKFSWVIYANHDTLYQLKEEIVLKDCKVFEVYHEGRLFDFCHEHKETVGSLLQKISKKFQIQKLDYK
tara:strand:+ start:372 stop:785 length:414 start_codon:yes stop_codon:yes gene_type:complete